MTPSGDPLTGRDAGDSPAHSLRWFRWLTALSDVPGLTRTDLAVAQKLVERAVTASGDVNLDGWRPTKRAISQQLFGLGPSAIGNSYARLKAAGVIVEAQSSATDGRPPLFRLVDDWRGGDAGEPHRWDLPGIRVGISFEEDEGAVEDATPRGLKSDPTPAAPSDVRAACAEGDARRCPGARVERFPTPPPGLQTSLFPESTP